MVGAETAGWYARASNTCYVLFAVGVALTGIEALANIHSPTLDGALLPPMLTLIASYALLVLATYLKNMAKGSR